MIWKYIKNFGGPFVIICIICLSLTNQFLGLANSYFVGLWSDQYTQHPDDVDVNLWLVSYKKYPPYQETPLTIRLGIIRWCSYGNRTIRNLHLHCMVCFPMDRIKTYPRESCQVCPVFSNTLLRYYTSWENHQPDVQRC